MAGFQARQGAGRIVARLVQRIVIASLCLALGSAAAAAVDYREYAVAVIDANTGQVMHSRQADANRYPASVTKVMTLYVLFQELAAGRMNLSTPLRVSRQAAAAQPSKLNVQAGSTITVEQAIKAIVTLSANDVARVIAENISGTESEFAERMTATARALGMDHTTYRNASGLPDSRQITTVRDQARLGMAIFQHFPQYYEYFQTRSFTFRGNTYGNHNRLLGQNGVDGIKTGYIQASGYNLLTAARANGRHVVIAAFGFETASSRDARVRELVNRYLPEGARGETRQAAMIPRPGGSGGGVVANPIQVALASPPPARPAYLEPELPPAFAQVIPAAPVSPIEPPDEIVVASIDPIIPAPPARPLVESTLAEEPMALMPVETAAPQRDTFTPANVLGNFILQVFGGPTETPREPIPFAIVPPEAIGDSSEPGDLVAPVPPAGNWTVQVGAAPSETGAYQLLTQAGANLAELSNYQSYVQHVERDGQSFFRARFVGFNDRDTASAMCEALKQKSINCLALPS